MSQRVIRLPRGGLLVKTSAGLIQVGVPPETIKDTIDLPEGVPRLFVMPESLFSVERAISFADLEFPIYYNFFLKKQSIIVVCTSEQRTRIRKILRESLFPSVNREKVVKEFEQGEDDPFMPDFDRELTHFTWIDELYRSYRWSDMIKFKVFKDKRPVRIGKVSLELYPKDRQIVLIDNHSHPLYLPTEIQISPPIFKKVESEEVFQPPMFGVSVLGHSHGFDPTSPTTGFVFWINGRGVMVDPPVDASLKLRNSNISPKLINDVILTHVHADHDAGLLQKFFEEGRINLYTTPVIYESFIRKSAYVTDFNRQEFKKLINFKPVMINSPVMILGGRFMFYYTLHPIPTIQFEVYYQGESIYYSADHLYDPEGWQELYRKGILTKNRLESLNRNCWNHSLVLHEAGIPPLHTPIKCLMELDEAIKERIYLVHVGKQNVPSEANLKLVPDSLDECLSIPISTMIPPEFTRLLWTLSTVDFFQDLPIQKIIDILPSVQRRCYQCNEVIFRYGEQGDEFHIIISGRVSISRHDQELIVYGPHDYYGEMAMISGKPRSADVVAKTEVVVLIISRDNFLAFIHETNIANHLQTIEQTRSLDSCSIIETSPVFGFITATQITQLQSIMTFMKLAMGTLMTEIGSPIKYGYIIVSGWVDVYQGQRLYCSLGQGGFVGEVEFLFPKINTGLTHQFTAIAREEVSCYRIEFSRLKRFARMHPGAHFRLLHYGKYTNQASFFGW